MDMAAVMTEMAASLAGIESLRGRTYPYPARRVMPPAAAVGWPRDIDPNLTIARGAWSATYPLLVVVAESDVEAARDALSQYMEVAGPSSVLVALNSGVRSAYDSAIVTIPSVEPISIAGTEYLAAFFDVAVTGRN